MKDVKYVRIVKATNGAEWYSDYIGLVYPVYPNHREYDGIKHYRTMIDSEERLFIKLSDCEEVTITPQPQQEVGETSIAWGCESPELMKMFKTDSPELKAFKKGYKLGVEHAKAKQEAKANVKNVPAEEIKAACSAKLQEGYTITAEQIKELVKMDRDSDFIEPLLLEWFPEVVQPAKTYAAGTKFIVGDDEVMLIKQGAAYRFIDLNTGYNYNFKSCIDEHITDKQIKALLQGEEYRIK